MARALAIALLAGTFLAASLPSFSAEPEVRAVTTFESAGLYWTAPGGKEDCRVRYRASGEKEWRVGFDLWFDARNNECRGSIVKLKPGTAYEAELGLGDGAYSRSVKFATWPEKAPVARTVRVPAGSATLVIDQGGSASGYVVYDGGGAVLDAKNGHDYNILVNASHVVVRNFVLRGARQDAIRIGPAATDVVIEDNDISGWGRADDQGKAIDMDSGIRAYCQACPQAERITIQRNRIHDPRHGANSWSKAHPAGPQAITFSYCGGNHVIRDNEIRAGEGRKFNDAIGGEDNFSLTGFPNADTDIYRNRISGAWDDGIEAEGGNRNVRVWGNYLDQTATGVASTVVHNGPLYIFRNVYNRSRMHSQKSLDSDDRNSFFKSGAAGGYGHGRRWVFHNTSLQAAQAGVVNGLGAGAGLKGNTNQPMTNTVSRNNIFHVWKSSWISVGQQSGSTGNDANYDLYNGSLSSFAGAEANGFVGTPIYAPGHGWESWAAGNYQLAPNSRGYDGGARLPNFNDGFTGAGPDVGAHEAGTPAMKFGIQ